MPRARLHWGGLRLVTLLLQKMQLAMALVQFFEGRMDWSKIWFEQKIIRRRVLSDWGVIRWRIWGRQKQINEKTLATVSIAEGIRKSVMNFGSKSARSKVAKLFFLSIFEAPDLKSPTDSLRFCIFGGRKLPPSIGMWPNEWMRSYYCFSVGLGRLLRGHLKRNIDYLRFFFLQKVAPFSSAADITPICSNATITFESHPQCIHQWKGFTETPLSNFVFKFFCQLALRKKPSTMVTFNFFKCNTREHNTSVIFCLFVTLINQTINNFSMWNEKLCWMIILREIRNIAHLKYKSLSLFSPSSSPSSSSSSSSPTNIDQKQIG